MNIRKATINDIWKLVDLRKVQLIDEGQEPMSDVDQHMYEFFKNRFMEDSIIQYLVEDSGEIIATGAVIFYEFPPSFTNISGIRAYIANMYTKDEYRGQGLAKKILNKLIEEVKAKGLTKIFLQASEMGRPVYKKVGFHEVEYYLEMDLS
ncbi:GNAT family N-acetyltransferase [Pallidibacillus thermolactis]|uniref:GNAT family N-acetyltransferase n=1 Tax=Pallidibacillus thermolactis TaxID=251051 RepID=UPI0021DB3E21|nr:GNAT family N-acetyltransferase [Pallidibacillus thermolactis]MCU9601949.1 GNAT family N-acetyltransferase [Pallidibacillus thermolactis subsp. kokeshiiformis]MED1673679.1 GNAT family N-acetyltransferase [Pallidibacillus thermolactis subsp. kokeshiiformis]